ncbi:beta-1,4-glucuronyltransferase 1-like [Periplaneta americana]|uniref:beta-1,4-glucuronyltransferase 1-like n=1 Tax=Periplaneta americana TaxID=6978 RepID=UPI0037E9ABE4
MAHSTTWKCGFASIFILTILNYLLSMWNIYYYTECYVQKINTIHLLHEGEVQQQEVQNLFGVQESLPAINNLPSSTMRPMPLQLNTTFDINLRLGRWDTKRLFKFFDFVVTGDRFVELTDSYSVCLATQCSLDKIYSLVEVSKHWTAPISLSVFVTGQEFILAEMYILYLRQCFPEIRDRTSFHLAYPSEYPATRDITKIVPNNQLNCSHPEQVLSELLKFRNPVMMGWRERYLYPQNQMRNHARRNCQTKYVWLTDVDIIPSIGMADKLEHFLKERADTSRTAYVIPVYELDESVSFPQNKEQLLKLIQKNKARPFHMSIFKPAQTPTHYSIWEENIKEGHNPVYVSHNVTGCPVFYEPFYVALASVPEYDERFIGYGFTRSTQVHEMLAAGYQFQVVSPIFSCHWGFQSLSKSYNNWRHKQVDKNHMQFRQFKNEIYARYPKTNHLCTKNKR